MPTAVASLSPQLEPLALQPSLAGPPAWAGKPVLVVYDPQTRDMFSDFRLGRPWSCAPSVAELPAQRELGKQTLINAAGEFAGRSVVVWPQPGPAGFERATADAAELVKFGASAVTVARLHGGWESLCCPQDRLDDYERAGLELIILQALEDAVMRAYPFRSEGTARAVLDLPAPPDMPKLFEDLRALVSHYVEFDAAALDTAVLWCLQTWIHGEFEKSPRLILAAEDPRADNSRALRVLSWFAPNPCIISRAHAACILPLIAQERPSLFLDDKADAMFHRRDMRSLVAAGASRDGLFSAMRGAQGSSPLMACSSPFAAATSKPLPEEVLAHAIVVPMRPPILYSGLTRLSIGEPPSRALALRARIQSCVKEYLKSQRQRAWPEVSISVAAREAWEPMFSLARFIGAAAEQAAVRAAYRFSAKVRIVERQSDLMLLADIRDKIGYGIGIGIRSTFFVNRLTADPDSFWNEYQKGKPLTTNGLAKVLRRFGVYPATIRQSPEVTVRGYKCADLVQAFARYLDDPGAGLAFRRGIKSEYDSESPDEMTILQPIREAMAAAEAAEQAAASQPVTPGDDSVSPNVMEKTAETGHVMV